MSTARPDIVTPEQWRAAREALLVQYGRQEEWEDSPEGWPQIPPYTWGGWHDTYDHTL